MAKYLVEDTSLTAIADNIRLYTGRTDDIAFTHFVSEIDNVADKAWEQGYEEGKGEGGIDTSDATATSSDILSGKTAYVDGLKITGNIAFQPAKTITPTISDQIAVSSGYYTGGIVTVKGDSNLIAENIKSGVSIFGVNGTLEESSGSEGYDEADKLIAGTMTSYTNSRVSTIGDGVFAYVPTLSTVSFTAVKKIGNKAFMSCSQLTNVHFPMCQNIGQTAFSGCSQLTSINFPSVSFIGQSAFQSCSQLTSANFPVCSEMLARAFYQCKNLTNVSFPAVTSIYSYTFYQCSKLTNVSFPAVTNIGSYAFQQCYKLSSFTLAGSSVCILSNSNAFRSTPYTDYSTYFSGTPYIYVPSSLVASYREATNWTYFSSYFSAIEDMPQ